MFAMTLDNAYVHLMLWAELVTHAQIHSGILTPPQAVRFVAHVHADPCDIYTLYITIM